MPDHCTGIFLPLRLVSGRKVITENTTEELNPSLTLARPGPDWLHEIKNPDYVMAGLDPRLSG